MAYDAEHFTINQLFISHILGKRLLMKWCLLIVTMFMLDYMFSIY